MTTMAGTTDQLTKAKNAAQAESAEAAPPCAMVIFGAGGDLTKRLLVPALYNLANAKRLSNGFQLVGVGRTAQTVEEWRKSLADMMKESIAQDDHIDQTAWRWLTAIKAIISMRVSQVTSSQSPESVGLTHIGQATSTEIGSLPNSRIIDIILDASCARNLDRSLSQNLVPGGLRAVYFRLRARGARGHKEKRTGEAEPSKKCP
jgi:Glucose-6-phosphate dehydrogenase, NAD binding domain